MYIIHERLRRLKAVSSQSDFVSTPLHVQVYNNPDKRHTLLCKGQYRKKCLVIIFYIEFRITLTMDKDILFIQCSLGIDVIEKFDYMNQVNKTN